MTTGRKPLPVETHKRRGSYRADRHQSHEAPAGDMEAPAWTPPGAAEVLPDVLAKVEQAGLSSPVYTLAAVLLADAVADFAHYCALADEQPRINTSASGHPQQHPATTLKNQSRKAALDLLREFGMTPSAIRSVSPATIDDEDNPLEALMKRRFFG